jgi:hypothetical protein
LGGQAPLTTLPAFVAFVPEDVAQTKRAVTSWRLVLRVCGSVEDLWRSTQLRLSRAERFAVP